MEKVTHRRNEIERGGGWATTRSRRNEINREAWRKPPWTQRVLGEAGETEARVVSLREGKNYWGCSSTLKYGNRRFLGGSGGMPPGNF